MSMDMGQAMVTAGTILVVDDQIVSMSMLMMILQEHGYLVKTVTNGQQALVVIATEPPDVVLLDVTMPGMDGYEVCARLKADESTRDIPVLFVSAHDDCANRMKGFSVGAVDYITKPFLAQEVVARVSHQITMRQMQRQLQEQNLQLEQHNRRLEQEIAERRQVETALRQNEERFRLLAENARDIVFRYRLTSPRGFEYVSPSVREIMGYTPEEYYADPDMDLRTLHPSNRVVFSVAVESPGTYREPVAMRHIRKDGSDVWLEQNHWHIVDEHGKVIAIEGITRDITERKRTEEMLRQAHDELEQRVQARTAELSRANRALLAEIEERIRHERQRESIVTVAAALRTAVSRTQMITILLQQIMRLLHAQAALIVAPDQHSDRLIVEQAHGQWRNLQDHVFDADTPWAYSFTNTVQPYLCNDAANDPRIQTLRLPGEMTAFVCVPLMAQEQQIGTICVGSKQPIERDDMRLLSAIADMAANALHRITLYEQTERRLQHLHALHMIDRSIMTNFDLHMTLSVLIYQVTTQLKVDAAAVLMLNHETQRLDYACGHGFSFDDMQQTSIALADYYPSVNSTGIADVIYIPDTHAVACPPIREAVLQCEAFCAYYSLPLIARGDVKGVLEIFHRTPMKPDQEWIDFMETLAGQASIAIDNADMVARLQRSNRELIQAYDATIEGWARTLELRDGETEGHSRRVTELTLMVAQHMGFTDHELVHIRRGAILHDIGKMGIPDHILLKSGPLTADEQAIMQRHPVYAYDLLMPIDFLRPALDIPYCHHEKWDGSGYPRGLRGTEIPITARIFAIVDVWDALRSNRPYRKAWPKERVIAYLRDHAGSHFDPDIVEVFLDVIQRAEEAQTNQRTLACKMFSL